MALLSNMHRSGSKISLQAVRLPELICCSNPPVPFGKIQDPYGGNGQSLPDGRQAGKPAGREQGAQSEELTYQHLQDSNTYQHATRKLSNNAPPLLRTIRVIRFNSRNSF